jgi:hypothetical protein
MVDMEAMTQARLSKQGWQPIQHGKLNAKEGETGRIPPPLGPSSVKEWVASSEAAMRHRAPAAVIVRTGDGALGTSSDVAMVDRGTIMASLAGNSDAAALTCARKKGRPHDVAGNDFELLYVVARYNIQHTTPAY